MAFFAPEPNPYFFPRPFTIPLFLKIVGSNPFYLITLQRIVYCICVLITILVITHKLNNLYIKLISQVLFLFYFTMWDIVGWSNNILSEFLSLSLMFLWFAVIILYYNKPNVFRFLCLLIVTFFLSFSRDTWPYIILLFALINFVIFKLVRIKALKLNVIFLVFSVALFIIQGKTAKIGERYKLPVFNSILGRVSQKQKYVDWFKERGMPISDSIVKDFRGVDIDVYEGRLKIYPKYDSQLYHELFDWIKKDGKSVYQNFVLTHPDYFFMQDQTPGQIDRIFCVDLYKHGYFQKPEKFFLNSDNFFPFSNIWTTVGLVICCVLLFIKKRTAFFLIPVVIIMLFFANVMLTYNADALEVHRHMYVNQIIIEFMPFVVIPYLIDYLLSFLPGRQCVIN